MRTYVFPKLGKRPVSDIDTADVLNVLTPIWHEKPETARRVRQRISTVMKWAVARSFRQDNPAGDAIGAALPKQNGKNKRHHRALPHGEVASAIEAVRASGSSAAVKLAFEFLILTAARSGEVRHMMWSEVDLDTAIWTIPADRMKAGREHRVPLRDERYDDYGLRDRVRGDVGNRKDNHDTFSDTATRYWAIIQDLCRAIDQGDGSIGLPPYNGGLFDSEANPLLEEVRISDTVMADVVDALSFQLTSTGRKYINYRDLSVQQLGSIYERLLEYEVIQEDGELLIRPNIFARKASGSYYTHEDLVGLIIRETIGPLVETKHNNFTDKITELEDSELPEDRKLGQLRRLDPAEKILELKVCDPAMGSGHFLVSLVDYLADQVITAMAEAEVVVGYGDYISPLSERIDNIRHTILTNAEERNWTVDEQQLDDRHIIRRIILKRCVYGVDKNPMAVELSKVSLWLHTFTVGAPLSFLDHHLRCGDSLFGSWVRDGVNSVTRHGAPLLLHDPITRAFRAASSMQVIEQLTDAEIAEAHRSAEIFDEISSMTRPLDALLKLIEAINWLNVRDANKRIATESFFDGEFGDPIEIASGNLDPIRPPARNAEDVMQGQLSAEEKYTLFSEVFSQCQRLIEEERFLSWQVAFPGVWEDWESKRLSGGFDAIIGNPPWERMKLQQVEWFAARKPDIAMAQRASDRRRLITALNAENTPLAADFQKANNRVDASIRVVRAGGNYPLLSSGELNLYALFVERALRLTKQSGIVGLLVPTGVASDKSAAKFIREVATEGRIKSLYDFENKGEGRELYFSDVHPQFKFCSFVISNNTFNSPTRCGFFLNTPADIEDSARCFDFGAEDFARVNPNTGTAPIHRNRRDAELTKSVYALLPVLVNKSTGEAVKTWPVQYNRVFDMTNHSALFKKREELAEEEGAYPTESNRFNSRSGEWIPLYEGKMIWHFDHRAASILINEANQHRPAYPESTTVEQHQDFAYVPEPQFWVRAADADVLKHYVIGFRDVTNPTDVRTMDAAIIPHMYAGNTLPIITFEEDGEIATPLLTANFNSFVFDYIARQKVQKNHLNWYIVEQLPVVPLELYENTMFGEATAEELVREWVLELTYTSNDMTEFAIDMGYVDQNGNALPPFAWDEERRFHLRSKLDALFFLLYGIDDREDVRYVFSNFGIVNRRDQERYGNFRTLELCLAYMNALSAGDPSAEINL